MNIGDVIKYKRQKKNMTQTELAERLNVTPQAVSSGKWGFLIRTLPCCRYFQRYYG